MNHWLSVELFSSLIILYQVFWMREESARWLLKMAVKTFSITSRRLIQTQLLFFPEKISEKKKKQQHKILK